jgi:uncharacterized protein YcnI
VRVEVQIPRLLRVEALEATPGWQVSVQRESGGRIVSAVWQGAEIGPSEFVEFGVLARNPEQATQLSWTLIQTYSDSSEVQWIGSTDRAVSGSGDRRRGATSGCALG